MEWKVNEKCALCEGKIEHNDPWRGAYCSKCFSAPVWQESMYMSTYLNLCFLCGRVALLRCTKCKLAAYCDKACQERHYAAHSPQCCSPRDDCGVNYPPTVYACELPGKTYGAKRDELLVEPRKAYIFDAKVPLAGKGASGTIVIAKEAATGKEVAIKNIIFKKDEDWDIPATVLHEMELRSLDDHNVVTICKAYLGTGFPPLFAMVMDKAIGSINKLMEDTYADVSKTFARPTIAAFEPLELKFLVYQILHSIAYIHSRLVAHFDIKIGNFLIYTDLPPPGVTLPLGWTTVKRVVLTDFGLSHGNYILPFKWSMRGTPQYCAPEVLFGIGYGIPQSDVWSAASTIYTLATNRFVHTDLKDKSHISLRQAMVVLMGEDTIRLSKVAPLLDNTLQSLPALKGAPGTLSKLLSTNISPYYPGLDRLLVGMFDASPSTRTTIFDALKNMYFDDVRELIAQTGVCGKNPTPVEYNTGFEVMPVDGNRVMLEREALLWKNAAADEAEVRVVYDNIMGAVVAHAHDVVPDVKTPYQLAKILVKALCIIMQFLRRPTLGGPKPPTPGSKVQSDLAAYARAACILADKYMDNIIDPRPLAEMKGMLLGRIREVPNTVMAERDIVEQLDFDLTFPSPADFVTIYMLSLYLHSRTRGKDDKYVTEAGLGYHLVAAYYLDSTMATKYPPSILAALAVYAASWTRLEVSPVAGRLRFAANQEQLAEMINAHKSYIAKFNDTLGADIVAIDQVTKSLESEERSYFKKRKKTK
jgi:serine/threonine protein kinase